MAIATAAPTLRGAWHAAHEPVSGVPRWARIAAYAVPFTVLPSGLWRIASVTFHLPIVDGGLPPDGGRGLVPAWLPMELYVIVLSILSELLAFTAVGLIARWGEVFPAWIPGLRGRRVPAAAAVIPGFAGAAILTALWTSAIASSLVFRETVQGRPLPDDFFIHFHNWKGVLGGVAYIPLVAWGPLLAALTFAYYRRRRTSRYS